MYVGNLVIAGQNAYGVPQPQQGYEYPGQQPPHTQGYALPPPPPPQQQQQQPQQQAPWQHGGNSVAWPAPAAPQMPQQAPQQQAPQGGCPVMRQ